MFLNHLDSLGGVIVHFCNKNPCDMALCDREKKNFQICMYKERVLCGLLNSELNVEQLVHVP